MEARISELELKILTFMHENVAGYTRLDFMDASPVQDALGCSPEELRRAVSYLIGWGLLGDCELGTYGDEGGAAPFHFTGLGENYVRLVEERLASEPGLPKRLTVQALSEAYKIGREIVIRTASSILAQQAQPHHLNP